MQGPPDGFDGKLSPPGGRLGPTGALPEAPMPPQGPMGGYPPPVMGAYGYGPPMQNQPLAVASLVCGIASFPMGCCCSVVSLPLAVAAIACGIVALTAIKKQPDRYTGEPLAIAGIAVGGVGLLLSGAMLVLGFGSQIFNALRHP